MTKNIETPTPPVVPEGTDERHYLNAIRRRLEALYGASADNPRLREQLSDEVDWVDAQLELPAATFHPDRNLPGCMMPDGGECCQGYVALYDAYWRLVRAPQSSAAPLGMGREAEIIERCAKIVEGRVVHHNCREWPAASAQGNRANDSPIVQHCDRLAAAIRALPATGGGEAS